MKKDRDREGDSALPESMDFATFVCELDNGQVNARLGVMLNELVRAVEDTGEDGTLTIKIVVGMEDDRALVNVRPEIKKPLRPMHGTLFFFGAEGDLHRENPKQLKLKDVSPAAKASEPLRAVWPPTKKDPDDGGKAS